jgi:hypothetical protein
MPNPAHSFAPRLVAATILAPGPRQLSLAHVKAADLRSRSRVGYNPTTSRAARLRRAIAADPADARNHARRPARRDFAGVRQGAITVDDYLGQT